LSFGSHRTQHDKLLFRTQTLEQCSTDCLNPDYRNTSAEVVQYAELVCLQASTSPPHDRCIALRTMLITGDVPDQMTELDAMIARVKPYAGCQLITRFVEATNEPLCVEYLYVIANLASAVTPDLS
jgi:hypothetical protein